MKNILLLIVFTSNSLIGQNISLESVTDYDHNKVVESLHQIGSNNLWYNVFLRDLKIPNGFEDYKIVHEIIDYDQVVYQACKSGIWTNDRLMHFINRWGIDTINCSPIILNSFVNGVIGNIEGQNMYILDENNNLDLTDDKAYPISDSIYNTHDMVFERYIDGNVTLDTAKILVISPERDVKREIIGLSYSYTNYKKSKVIMEDSEVEIQLFPGRWYLYHKEPRIVVTTEDTIVQSISKNQYFKVNNSYYKISSINKKGNNIAFIKHPINSVPISNQIGYSPPDFQVTPSLNLSELKGKYVYLYFWNIDCSPCLVMLPKKFVKYSTPEYKNFEVILISTDKPSETQQFLDSNYITWTNVETYGNSKLYNEYDISQFPIEFLINPEGLIVASGVNIRLEDYILE